MAMRRRSALFAAPSPPLCGAPDDHADTQQCRRGAYTGASVFWTYDDKRDVATQTFTTAQCWITCN